MLRRAPALAAAAAAVIVLTTGCAGGASEPTRSATPSESPTIAPLAIPTRNAAEITRSTFADGVVADPAGSTSSSGALAVEVACSGLDGSRMRWSLVAGDGAALGLSGEADCTGPDTTSSLGITADRRPAQVRVRLQPSSGTAAGYAIVRRSTF